MHVTVYFYFYFLFSLFYSKSNVDGIYLKNNEIFVDLRQIYLTVNDFNLIYRWLSRHVFVWKYSIYTKFFLFICSVRRIWFFCTSGTSNFKKASRWIVMSLLVIDVFKYSGCLWKHFLKLFFVGNIKYKTRFHTISRDFNFFFVKRFQSRHFMPRSCLDTMSHASYSWTGHLLCTQPLVFTQTIRTYTFVREFYR